MFSLLELLLELLLDSALDPHAAKTTDNTTVEIIKRIFLKDFFIRILHIFYLYNTKCFIHKYNNLFM